MDCPGTWQIVFEKESRWAFMNPAQNSSIAIEVGKNALKNKLVTVDATTKFTVAILKQQNSDFNLINQNNKFTFAGLKGCILEYTMDNCYMKQYLLKLGNDMLTIAVAVPMEKQDKTNKEIEMILDSFKILSGSY